MSRFCPQCGNAVKETARFCRKCGHKLRQRQALRPSGPPAATEPPAPPSVPPPGPAPAAPVSAWTGWEAPSPPEPAQPAPEAAAPGAVPEPAAAPPQYWESYDYPSQPEPSGGKTWESYDYGSPRPLPSDASRPLPPLSQVMPNDLEMARERAREITMNFSLWAAAVVLFPIPFSDLVLLMPIQSAMVIAIGRAYGVKDPPEKVLAILAGACGASVFGQITTIFVSNLIPIIGKFVSAPFVFGWTYGLGEVAMRYFETQGEATQDELRKIFKKASREASRHYSPERADEARRSLDGLRDAIGDQEYERLRSRFGQPSR